MNKILLLEDDCELAETIEELLRDNNYDVDLVLRANDAIEASYKNTYDLYIFDINVPDMSGLELLESLREADDMTPTIFISALVDINSLTKAFEVGADDYLKKPFFPQELLIRINAKLIQKIKEIKYKDLSYLVHTKELYKNAKIIPMGDTQRSLCHLFFNNIGNTLDKSILMDCLQNPSPTALRVALNKLKKTLGIELKNIRGIGYILEKS